MSTFGEFQPSRASGPEVHSVNPILSEDHRGLKGSADHGTNVRMRQSRYSLREDFRVEAKPWTGGNNEHSVHGVRTDHSAFRLEGFHRFCARDLESLPIRKLG